MIESHKYVHLIDHGLISHAFLLYFRLWREWKWKKVPPVLKNADCSLCRLNHPECTGTWRRKGI